MSEESRHEAEAGGPEAAPDDHADTEERGDLAGATSTHAGAGGVMDHTGGTGTAPTGGDH